MTFFYILYNLHPEITIYLSKEDILNLFSIAKECFRIDYTFKLNYKKYNEISNKPRFKKFYPDAIVTKNISVLTQEIANYSKIFTTYSYLISNKCFAKKFKFVSLENINDETVDLSEYNIKKLYIRNCRNSKIKINCCELDYLDLINFCDTILELEHISSCYEMELCIDDSVNITLLGIPDNNKIILKGMHSAVNTNTIFDKIYFTYVREDHVDDTYNSVIEILDKSKLRFRKAYLSKPVWCSELNTLDENLINNINLSSYCPNQDEEYCLFSNNSIYENLLYYETTVPSSNKFSGIQKNKIYIETEDFKKIHKGLTLENCKINYFSIYRVHYCLYEYLYLDNVKSISMFATYVMNLKAMNSSIDYLTFGSVSDKNSTLILSNCKIIELSIGIYNNKQVTIENTTIENIILDLNMYNKENFQKVLLPNFSKKYSLRGIYCELTKIEAENVEELIILDYGKSVKIIEIIANPKILEIPKKLVKLISINGIKLTESHRYKLRKIFKSFYQYVLDYQ